MGIGAFSSESDTRVETTNTAFNQGFSEIGGAATSINLNITGKQKVGKGGSLVPTVNLTDHGALATAQGIVQSALAQLESFGATVGQAISGANANAGAAQAGALGLATEAGRSETENVTLNAIKWGALALVAYFIARSFWKGGSS